MGVQAVFLVGFMASGKSSVGQELARRRGWEFLDLDTLIESYERKSVPAIFRDHGESHFRQAETGALREVVANLERSSVVALGGGAFVQESNRHLLRGWPSVFLDAPPDELWRRCSEDPAERPLRRNHAQFVQLYHERLPFYRMATVTVETSGRDVPSICSEIEARLHLVGAPAGVQGNPSPTPSQTGESR
jgi:shikimate kinase